MSAANYGMMIAVTEAAPTRKNFFVLVMCALRESRARQARREIYRHRHLLANEMSRRKPHKPLTNNRSQSTEDTRDETATPAWLPFTRL